MLLGPSVTLPLSKASCDAAVARLNTNFSVVMATEQVADFLPVLHYLFGRRHQGHLLPAWGQWETDQRRKTPRDPFREQLQQDHETLAMLRNLSFCDARLYARAKQLGALQLQALQQVAKEAIRAIPEDLERLKASGA